MAAILSLEYTERNDNKLLTLTDISTDWPSDPNGPVGVDISTLTLSISITTSDSVTTDYDTIDLVALNSLNAGSVKEDLVFNIDASMIQDGGVAIGTTSDVLPDGIYEFHYILNNGDPVFFSELNE